MLASWMPDWLGWIGFIVGGLCLLVAASWRGR